MTSLFSIRTITTAAVAVICWAQLSAPLRGQNVFPSSGNVGIGTSSPSTPLEIRGSAPQSPYWKVGDGTNYVEYYGGGYNDFDSWGASLRFYAASNDIVFRTGTVDPIVTFKQSGNVGIGNLATNPPFKLLVQTATQWDGIVLSNGSSYVGYIAGQQSNNDHGELALLYQNLDGVVLRAVGQSFLNGGYVGIGTTSPQHLLHVAGTIGAEEVIVSSTGADYVFQPDYRLRPLREVKAFIESNRHLPDIPSAAEVKEKGVDLGDMQSKLLAKVEELTLHMIQAEERSNRLEAQNKELQERLSKLEARPRVGN